VDLPSANFGSTSFVARGSVQALLNWLDTNGADECPAPGDQTSNVR